MTPSNPKSHNTSSGALAGLAEQSGRIVEEVQELGRVAIESASEAATALRDKGRGALEDGREHAAKAKGQLEDYVTSHPTKALLIALGAGAALALFLNRRN